MAFRNVLVVDDEESMRHVLSVILRDNGYEVRSVSNGEDALKEIAARDYDVVITDVRMPRVDGFTLLKEVQQQSPETTVVVMSAYGSHDTALQAVKAGAYDYISKPFKPDEVVLVLRKAEERERLRRANRVLRGEVEKAYPAGHLIGRSKAIEEVKKLVRRVAETKTTVLIGGESGTGKELVARAVHELSPRAQAPFVAVNCGAIPEQLMESELFGYVKGAFTDARTNKKGLIEEADGGTLFLDEIGELPLLLQVKLLRFLQEEEVRRVGDTRSEKVDVRVVAATVRDLNKEVAEGRFREDLFYRLNVVPVRVPNLRERPEDIEALGVHFIQRYNARMSKHIQGFTASALDRLQSYAWPGNVRELENAVERAMVLCETDLIGPEVLPDKVLAPPRGMAPSVAEGDLSIKKASRALEADLIRRALARTGGNRTRAALLLEISHRALLYKIKEYGIDA